MIGLDGCHPRLGLLLNVCLDVDLGLLLDDGGARGAYLIYLVVVVAIWQWWQGVPASHEGVILPMQVGAIVVEGFLLGFADYLSDILESITRTRDSLLVLLVVIILSLHILHIEVR